MNEGRYRWFVAMGAPRPSRGRPGGGRHLPGPGGAALPAGLLPGRATHRGHQGPDLDRAGQAVARPRTGPGTEACPSPTTPAICASSTTSPSCVCSSPSTGHTRTPAPLDQAAGLLDRLRDAAETSGRAGSLLEIRMLQALAHDAQGRRPQALECLAQALGAGARTRGLRPALPGRGRSHARACCATPSTWASAAHHARRLLSLDAAASDAGTHRPRGRARRRRRRSR